MKKTKQNSNQISSFNDAMHACSTSNINSKWDIHYRFKYERINRCIIVVSGKLQNILSRDMCFQQCGMCDQQRLRPACAYAQSDQSLCLSLGYSMIVKLLAEQHLEFLNLKRGCAGYSESILVKMPHCWKHHVAACITFTKDTISSPSFLCGRWYPMGFL